MARLLLDECISPNGLADFLRGKGHYVVVSREAGLKAASDDEVVEYAKTNQLVVVTTNAQHFRLREMYCKACGVIACDQMSPRLLKERLGEVLEQGEDTLLYKFTHLSRKAISQKR